MNRVWLILVTAMLTSPFVSGGGIRSFVDESGVKVFTNGGTDRRSLVDLVSSPVAAASGRMEELKAPYLPLIREISDRYGVDNRLVEAVIQVESAFDPTAISVKDCRGLMQLHPDTAERFGVEDVFDPAQNIEGGVRYLQFLSERFDGDLEKVLAAYNAGENAVIKHKGIPPYSETRQYIKKVSNLFEFSDWNAGRGAETPKRPNRIHRMVLEDGTVVLTNTPTRATLN